MPGRFQPLAGPSQTRSSAPLPQVNPSVLRLQLGGPPPSSAGFTGVGPLVPRPVVSVDVAGPPVHRSLVFSQAAGVDEAEPSTRMPLELEVSNRWSLCQSSLRCYVNTLIEVLNQVPQLEPHQFLSAVLLNNNAALSQFIKSMFTISERSKRTIVLQLQNIQEIAREMPSAPLPAMPLAPLLAGSSVPVIQPVDNKDVVLDTLVGSPDDELPLGTTQAQLEEMIAAFIVSYGKGPADSTSEQGTKRRRKDEDEDEGVV